MQKIQPKRVVANMKIFQTKIHVTALTETKKNRMECIDVSGILIYYFVHANPSLSQSKDYCFFKLRIYSGNLKYPNVFNYVLFFDKYILHVSTFLLPVCVQRLKLYNILLVTLLYSLIKTCNR